MFKVYKDHGENPSESWNIVACLADKNRWLNLRWPGKLELDPSKVNLGYAPIPTLDDNIRKGNVII